MSDWRLEALAKGRAKRQEGGARDSPSAERVSDSQGAERGRRRVVQFGADTHAGEVELDFEELRHTPVVVSPGPSVLRRKTPIQQQADPEASAVSRLLAEPEPEPELGAEGAAAPLEEDRHLHNVQVLRHFYSVYKPVFATDERIEEVLASCTAEAGSPAAGFERLCAKLEARYGAEPKTAYKHRRFLKKMATAPAVPAARTVHNSSGRPKVPSRNGGALSSPSKRPATGPQKSGPAASAKPRLEVSVSKCRGLSRVDTFGTREVFVEVEVEGVTRRSSTVEAGTAASWGSATGEMLPVLELKARPRQQTRVQVRVYDEDTLSKNELIGHHTLKLRTGESRSSEWLSLKLKGKAAGEVRVAIVWHMNDTAVGADSAAPPSLHVESPQPVSSTLDVSGTWITVGSADRGDSLSDPEEERMVLVQRPLADGQIAVDGQQARGDADEFVIDSGVLSTLPDGSHRLRFIQSYPDGTQTIWTSRVSADGSELQEGIWTASNGDFAGQQIGTFSSSL